MIRPFFKGIGVWWRLGPRSGSRTVLRAAARRTRGRLREVQLLRRPLAADSEDVERALARLSAVEALCGPVLASMPVVASFERELSGLSEEARRDLLRRADDICAHRFDLLGSGPVALGPEIDWHSDFKTGRHWPLAHISRVAISYPDDSDIKVPWELSRFQHLPLLAAARRVSGDRRYLDEIAAQLERWIAANPVEFGPNWVSTMDVAIRTTNWIATLALCAREAAGQPWLERVLESLLLHGRFIRDHLEYGEVHGNHYLSNVVGLLPAAALFSRSPEGHAWTEWAAAELVSEMEHQVRPDGCAHEASIPYHRLVCELFVCGTQAVDELAPGTIPDWYRKRLAAMLEFVADYSRPDGLAPQIGDADDGRFLPLDDYGRTDFRSHIHLFAQSGRPYRPAQDHAAYRHGGYYVMRGGDLYALVRCGDTGLGGLGAHAHNDQLSFELALGPQPMVIDPGTFLYTGNPHARTLFRSTAFHSTLRVGGSDQNETRVADLFAMADRTRAEAITWTPAGGSAVFEGRHHGFEALAAPASYTRRFEFDGTARALVVRDLVRSDASHLLEWTFPLAPCSVRVAASGVTAEFESGCLVIESDGLEFVVEDGWYSPSYGVRIETPFVRARRWSREGEDMTEFRLTADGGMGDRPSSRVHRSRPADLPTQASTQ